MTGSSYHIGLLQLSSTGPQRMSEKAGIVYENACLFLSLEEGSQVSRLPALPLTNAYSNGNLAATPYRLQVSHKPSVHVLSVLQVILRAQTHKSADAKNRTQEQVKAMNRLYLSNCPLKLQH